ncbi:MAG: hypothetical protein ACRESZ_02285, partial [Methylococcales bacterium]
SMMRQIKGWSPKKKKSMILGDCSEVCRLAKINPFILRQAPFDKLPSTSSGRTDLFFRDAD